jgi:FtsP/CotA-like multicopper oxidase with cupredoxin domain
MSNRSLRQLVTPPIAAALAAVVLTACATIDPRSAFEATRDDLTGRHPGAAVWLRLDGDRAAAQRAREILDTPLTPDAAAEVALFCNPALQPHIKPGETYVSEFRLRQHGTFMYHPHADETVQMALGMMGFFVVHPRAPGAEAPDRDFCLFPHMWAIRPGTVIKVRDGLESYADPGWFEYPAGTLAWKTDSPPEGLAD